MHILRSFAPVVGRVSLVEAGRAGLGAFIGLGLTGLFVLSTNLDARAGLYLVAPFGATSVLLFAVPNSPLAQPWSAVVGNTVAALVGVAVCMIVADPGLRIACAVGFAIMATALCRAVHPPAGAVAMTAAMSPDAIGQLGFWFALAPIGVGTVTLVLVAALYARLTGRCYPFRQFNDTGRHGTGDADPQERLGLTEEELAAILKHYRQSFNVGIEDLARLIGAAELQAATHGTGPTSAGDIMSKDLITVEPDTGLTEVADLFRRHRFTSLPVVGPNDAFLGVIFQLHLLEYARNDAPGARAEWLPSVVPLFGRQTQTPVRAAAVMSVRGPCATPQTPIGALLPMMAEGEVDAVPVLEDGRITGIVTRTDLIAAMARTMARAA